MSVDGFTGFAPQAGVLLAMFMRAPRNRWARILLIAVPVQGVLALAGMGGTNPWGLWAATLAAPLLAAAVFARSPGRPTLMPASSVVWFLLAVSAGTVVAALVYLPLMTGRDWIVAVMSIGVGMFVGAPLLLSWHAPSHPRSLVEVLLSGSALVMVSIVLFGMPGDLIDAPVVYLAVPPMTWAAFRFGMPGASASTAVVALAATVATSIERGPFVAVVGGPYAMALTQMFVLVAALTTYLLAAAVDDIQDHREVEAQLRHLAYHDPLTGLPNRAQLWDVLRSAAELGQGAAVLIVDVDDFKVVNDALGHPSGDELLVALSQRVRRCLRPGDTLARMSGDEFVVVLPASGDAVVDAVARRILSHVSTPLALGESGELRPSVSIGIACGEGAFDVEKLLADADAALYRAKERGKARSSRFDDDLRAEVGDRLLIMTDFDPALRDGDLHWLFQPEIDVRSGELFSVEALCRWEHARGSIGPDRFVPVLESSGHAGRLFAGALDAALRAQREMVDLGGPAPAVAVNVSPTLLSTTGLADWVGGEIEARGTDPGSVWLEVTESAIATRGAARNLHELHGIGVQLAIDDFGTGWSSLGRLAMFHWDLIKIDRSFISVLGEEDHVVHLVAAMIAMAHSLDILVAAEGVETLDQLRIISELGCDVAQGWLFAPAQRVSDVAGMVDPNGIWTGPAWDMVPSSG
jgi:diguanylate cyclase (GGDEF)-like protein